MIDTIHELKVPWFGLAVGGVGIIENKRTPNYMFRVATNDREVAKFLVNYGMDKAGGKKFAILNEDSGWGVPAIADLQAALKERDLEPASADKMKVGDSDFTPQMLRAKNAGADTILSFSNAVEMANALKAGNKIGYKPKVLSAWGLANPTFPSLAGPLADGVMVMQTFTFVQNTQAEGGGALQALHRQVQGHQGRQRGAVPELHRQHLRRHAHDRAGDQEGRRHGWAQDAGRAGKPRRPMTAC